MVDQNSDKYKNWQTATKSGSGEGCIAVSFDDPDTVAIRDSKLGDDSPILVYTNHEWACFLDGISKQEFPTR